MSIVSERVNNIGVNRKLWIFAIIIPLAVYLGWMITEPESTSATMVVAS